MSDETDIENSRQYEMQVYLDSMKAMYENALLQNGEIYDIAAEVTQDFRSITAKAILFDSRIIKILRYAIAPSISQMKFGQLFGISSINTFEKAKVSAKTAKYQALKAIAPKIASFVKKRVDRRRFLWLQKSSCDNSDLTLARSYAKNWTCSIVADQNAQTRYRNWRKDQQEHAISQALVDRGYTRSAYRGIVSSLTDIEIGEYSLELRVQGRTRQKADLVVRSKSTKRLVLIEAKAVGVEIDSTKRIKECCDKANDWRSSSNLEEPVVVVVIAGFFNPTGIENLRASEIEIVWEHRLSDMERLL